MEQRPDFVDDTRPEALRVFYELQRQRTAAQKLDDVFELSEWLWESTKRGVRMRFPGIKEREVFLRAAALRLPRDIMIKAYGWDPAEHG